MNFRKFWNKFLKILFMYVSTISHGRLARWRKWKSCDVGEAKEGLENELCYDYNYELCSFSKLLVTSPTSQLFWFSKLSVTSPTPQLILQPFSRFTYVTAHSPTLPLCRLRHSSFSNPSAASPTSQLILQAFFRFSYVRLFTYVTWRAAHVSLTLQLPFSSRFAMTILCLTVVGSKPLHVFHFLIVDYDLQAIIPSY